MQKGKNVLLLLLGILVLRVIHANEIQKVFHHKMIADASQLHAHIEIGKIVVYCLQEPHIQKPSEIVKKDYKEITFFLPGCSINSLQAKQMALALNNSKQKFYQAKIIQTSNPTPGIEVIVQYDPAYITIATNTFDTISESKAFEVRMLNKILLETLQKNQVPVLKTASNAKPTVIIDCGHGGKDSGTQGYYNTIEKDITLAVGRELAAELKNHNMPVILTRNDDRYLEIDERTFLANSLVDNALLISLHANNAKKKEVSGLETFCLASTAKKGFSLDVTIDPLIAEYDKQSCHISKKLAQIVHASILNAAQAHNYHPTDRKVKQAMASILHGTRWPSALIELDFLSNEHTAHLLKDVHYQKILARGICNGLQEFIEKSYN